MNKYSKQTHTRFTQNRRTPLLLCGAALLVAPLAFAQDAEEEEEVFELSPFTVEGSQDEGYRATSTLAGTRIRSDLKDLGTAISAYTEEFMRDIAATDNTTLLQYTTNAEVGGTQSTYAGGQNGATLNESGALTSPHTNNRVRGLTNADNTRDFVVSDIPWDGYNTDRIDVLRGANSFLFGLGSPAGMVNATLNGAAFQDSNKAEIRLSSYGSVRGSVNLNKVILEDELSVRFAGLRDEKRYRQEQAFENDSRAYLTIRYEPKFLASDSMKSAFNVKFEDGNIDANRPRNITPMDGMASWFRDREKTADNPFGGLGRVLIENPFEAASTIQNSSSPEYSPWVGTAANQQQPFWLIDGASGQVFGARAGIINNGARNSNGTVRSSSEGVVGRRNTSPFLASAQLSDAAIALRLPNASTGLYKAESMQDASVFDFYNQLIDGDTKWEKANWDALNLDFTQTFFSNRLGVQVVYDKQKYERSNESLLGWQPTVKMDIMQNWDDFSPNVNVGRPYVTTSTEGSGGVWSSDREYARASLYGQISASDFLESDGFLAKLLGTHRFTSVVSKDSYGTESYAYYNAIADADWYSYWTTSNGMTYPFTDRMPIGIVYLGDSIANRTTLSGANIPAVSVSNIDYTGGTVKVFDTTWVAGPGVAFDAPWTNIPANIAGAYNVPAEGADPLMQNSNPANYLGWTDHPLGLIRRDENNPNLSRLDYTMSDVESTAVNLQSYWWENALVTTVGWRTDTVTSNTLPYNKDPANRYFVTVPVEREPRELEGESISGGAVLHLNKLFGGNDPLPINVSLSYNKGRNFNPTAARNDIYGNEIANPSGKTKDLGIALSTKDGKYTLRAVKYESYIKDASTSLDAWNIGSTIANGLSWRNIFLYRLGAYSWADREQYSYRNHASNAFPIDGDASLPYHVAEFSAEERALEDAMITGWNDIQAWLTERGFFEAWSMNPVPLQYLTDRSTYEATLNGKDPAAQYLPPTGTVSNYSFAFPQNFAVTADVKSQGYEFELMANPTENLRIAFNASSAESVNYNVGGELLNEFVNYMNEALVGTPAGSLPRWGGYGGAIGPSIWSGFQAKYTLMKLQEGSAVPELRKWRYNLVTNYTFKDGKLKGLGVGGSYRWQDKMAISYPLVGTGSTTYTYDLDNPIYAPAEDFIDLWASYGRKLTDKVDWRIQVNIRNVGQGDELIPVTIQPDPDHTVAGVRISPTQEWSITNTFKF